MSFLFYGLAMSFMNVFARFFVEVMFNNKLMSTDTENGTYITTGVYMYVEKLEHLNAVIVQIDNICLCLQPHQLGS